MTKQPNRRIRYRKNDMELLIKALQSYVNKTIDILEYKDTSKTANYIDPVLAQIMHKWGTSDLQIIAAAMYDYGYIEGIRAERMRRKTAPINK